MKNSLTIFDDSVFYVQGLSLHLKEQQFFGDIIHQTDLSSFQKHYRNRPTSYIFLGTCITTFSEICGVIDFIHNRNANARILVIGKNVDALDMRKLFEKRISCYIDCDTEMEEFLNAVEILKNGKIYICNSAKERMVNFISHKNFNNSGTETLTKRELEVLKLISDGHSSKQISEKLFISINTVETHRKKILLKLNVKNSVGMVKYAVEHHMLE